MDGQLEDEILEDEEETDFQLLSALAAELEQWTDGELPEALLGSTLGLSLERMCTVVRRAKDLGLVDIEAGADLMFNLDELADRWFSYSST